jgi:hypothetical protein
VSEGECGPCPVFALVYTPAFALQLRKNHGKTSVGVAEKRPTEDCWAQFVWSTWWPFHAAGGDVVNCLGSRDSARCRFRCLLFSAVSTEQFKR